MRSCHGRGLVEASLNEKLDSVFRSFDDKPLGAASIGQVHRATLKDGRDVVVKVCALACKTCSTEEQTKRDLEGNRFAVDLSFHPSMCMIYVHFSFLYRYKATQEAAAVSFRRQ